MKILHTSDWHLGHILYNYDRREEQLAMLAQMAEIVGKEQPDVFLLAGDVYDSTQPSASVQTMFSDALVKIHQACESMAIVCISGNHDSSSKHMIFHLPWKVLNVNMIGNIVKEGECFDNHIIKIEGKGYIVAVPYAADRNMPENFYQKLQEHVAERNFEERLPVVLTAHLAVSGCDFKGHENATDKMVGGLDCQSISVFGEGFDYVALGHIHRAQDVDGSQHRIRYSGTPIAVGFDEVSAGYDHGVSIVEIDRHGGMPHLRTIGINNLRPLVNLPMEGFAEWEAVKKLFADYPTDIPSYIRLNVLVDDYLPANANDEAMQIAGNKLCKFCLINAKRKGNDKKQSLNRHFTVSEFQRQTPLDVARMYLEAEGEPFDDELQALFEEALKQISGYSDRYDQ